MKNLMKDWVRKTFPQKAEQIIKGSLSEKKIRQAGIELYDHEIFVLYKWGYYGSNYGRVITTKNRKMKLRKETADNTGHICYVLTQQAPRRKGEIIGEPQREVIGAQRLVAELFLPNYWAKCTRRQLEVHHLDKNPKNNRWDNLVLFPGWIHKWAEYIDTYWIGLDGKMIQKTPYEIMDLTGLTMEEIIYPIKRECDLRSHVDGHDIEVYNIGKWYLGYELDDPNFRQILLERGRHMGKSPRKKKKSEQE